MDDRHEVMRAMLGREHTGAALVSERVDADFWALICADEEWLRAEFEAIVSEPAEVRVRPSRRFAKVDSRPVNAGPPMCDSPRRWRIGMRPGPARRRQRSPPSLLSRRRAGARTHAKGW